MDQNQLVIGGAFLVVGILILFFAFKARKAIIGKAHQEAESIMDEAQKGVIQSEERVNRLKTADKEIASRLRQSRAIMEGITDQSSALAADVELLNEDDLLSSQSYQEDRKAVKARLKKLAVDAIDGVKGGNSDVNIGKFVAISAKADMAGALLITTVEMLCSKTSQQRTPISRKAYRNNHGIRSSG